MPRVRVRIVSTWRPPLWPKLQALRPYVYTPYYIDFFGFLGFFLAACALFEAGVWIFSPLDGGEAIAPQGIPAAMVVFVVLVSLAVVCFRLNGSERNRKRKRELRSEQENSMQAYFAMNEVDYVTAQALTRTNSAPGLTTHPYRPVPARDKDVHGRLAW